MSFMLFQKRSLIRSLAGRVFLVSALLLILPLALHTLLLYRHEYKESIKDLSISLNILCKNSTLFVEESLDFRKHLLSDLANRMVHEKIPVEKRAAFIEEQKNALDVPKLFYLANPKEFAEIFEKEEGGFIGKIVGKEGYIYLSQVLPDSGAILLAFPAKDLIDRLASFENYPFVTSMSLITEGQLILASSSFVTSDSLVMAPDKDIDKFYTFTNEGASYFARVGSIENANFSLMLSVSKDSIIKDLRKDYLRRIASAFFFLFFIGGGLALWFIFRLSKPLESLFWTMQKVKNGDLYARFHKEKFGFEINILGNIFNQMIDALLVQEREAEKERMQKLAFLQELRIGHEIQQSMFPSEVPHIPSLEISPGYLPAKEVGGDFYDLFVPEKDKLMVVIADTSGKGVPACLYSLSVRSMLRSFASLSSNVEEILSRVNQLFYLDSERQSVFVTIWTGIYDEKTHLFHYASSGHYPPLLKRKNQTIEEIHLPGMAIGIDPNCPVRVGSFSFEVGDTLLLYTDGVIDARSKEGSFFGKERLKNFFSSSQTTSAQLIKEELLLEIGKFAFDETQHDDITLLVIRRLS